MGRTHTPLNDSPADLLAAGLGVPKEWRTPAGPLDALAALVGALRKAHPIGPDGVASIAPFIAHLRQHPEQAEALGSHLRHTLRGRSIRSAFSDPGIVAHTELFSEVMRRLTAKVLPELPEERSIARVLGQVLHQPAHAQWFLAIPEQELLELMHLLGMEPVREQGQDSGPISDLAQAAVVLSHRINGRAMEPAVLRMVPELDRFENPFLGLQRELDDLQERLRSPGEAPMAMDDRGLRHLMVIHGQCLHYVEQAYTNSERFGISVRVTQNLLRMQQQLERLTVIIGLLGTDAERTPERRTIALVRTLVAINAGRNKVRHLLEESTRLVAYEITQHTGRTGEHYITSSAREYWRMLGSAAAGGAIVAVMCVIKVMLAYLHPPLFGKALLASLNYAWGFIAIYLLGATLATKQPAMTAAALVKSLKEHDGERGAYSGFADLFARLFRSQFIAFVGNVLLAFPMALLLVMGIERVFRFTLGAPQWPTLIGDLHPVTSLALLHAAIAGVFLFLSGIIAGSVANRGRFDRIPQRIAEHPLLKRVLGPKRARSVSRFYARRWAGILSNMWFGVFMGSTAAVGLFFGLPLDVRHITFAAGNLAIGLHGANFQLTTAQILWSVLGIGLIGLVNFLVSFTLSLSLAMRSRSISVRELDDLARAVWRHFRRHPLRFFVPTPSSQRAATKAPAPGH